MDPDLAPGSSGSAKTGGSLHGYSNLDKKGRLALVDTLG